MTVVNSYTWSPHFYAGRGGYSILWIVLHDMEAPEASTTAESVARYFAAPTTQASAHYCVDNDSIVQCVKRGDRAWHAGSTGNRHGIGIEMAGYAKQTRTDWLDTFSRATIRNAAKIAAEDALELGIPARTLTDEQVRGKSAKGVVTHAQLTRVFGESTHTDPGAGFPMDVFLADMASFMAPAPAGGRGMGAPIPGAKAPTPTPAPQPAPSPGDDNVILLIDHPETGVWYHLTGGCLIPQTRAGADAIKASGAPWHLIKTDKATWAAYTRGLKVVL